MKTLFKLAHLLIVGLFVITGNDIYDLILGAAIAVIAYVYAFTFTRRYSNSLGYNSILMSFVHWSVRTIISIMMIVLTRPFYIIVKSMVGLTNVDLTDLISVVICAAVWIFVAETVKSMTGLRKNYW